MFRRSGASNINETHDQHPFVTLPHYICRDHFYTGHCPRAPSCKYKHCNPKERQAFCDAGSQSATSGSVDHLPIPEGPVTACPGNDDAELQVLISLSSLSIVPHRSQQGHSREQSSSGESHQSDEISVNDTKYARTLLNICVESGVLWPCRTSDPQKGGRRGRRKVRNVRCAWHRRLSPFCRRSRTSTRMRPCRRRSQPKCPKPILSHHRRTRRGKAGSK